MTAKLLTALSSLNISVKLISVKGVNQLINVLFLFYESLKGSQRNWPKPNRKQKQKHTNNQTKEKKQIKAVKKKHSKTHAKNVRVLQP